MSYEKKNQKTQRKRKEKREGKGCKESGVGRAVRKKVVAQREASGKGREGWGVRPGSGWAQ